MQLNNISVRTIVFRIGTGDQTDPPIKPLFEPEPSEPDWLDINEPVFKKIHEIITFY